jgi:predicted membrane protein DUF2079
VARSLQGNSGTTSTIKVNDGREARRRRGLQCIRQFALLWILFFLICFGLGYPTLKRYQPNHTEGLSDTAAYYQLVTGGRLQRPRADVFEGRILIPFLAKPFSWFAKSYLAGWEPVFFGLLIANSFFCATAAILLFSIGRHIGQNSSVALLAAMLYLLNFAIANLQLAGLVDSGEACLLLAVTWSLLAGRWWMLPLCGVAGVLSKETFMPVAAIFSIVWWIVLEDPHKSRLARFGWIVAMILLSNATIILLHYTLHSHIVWPWQIASAMNSGSDYLLALLRCISDRSFWYIFVWLLPLGVWRLKCLPRPWVVASNVTALAVLALGAYSDMAGTVGRPIFNTIGPMLSLSTAIFLSDQGKNFAGRSAWVAASSESEEIS